MGKTKIEWCDRVWNPVWGCKTGCEYCYARKIAKRFFKKIADAEFEYRKRHNIETSPLTKPLLRAQIKQFEPIFMFKNYGKLLYPLKRLRIFVNSMSDIRWWKKEWMSFVLDKIERYPQHIFQFLTKFPGTYTKYKFPKNCWLGVTITYGERRDVVLRRFLKNDNIKFISFEPLLAEVFVDYFNNFEGEQFPNWVIIGAQTNPYKPPKREWVEKIIKKAKENNIPVFLKDNLFRAYPDLPELQEFPNFPKLQELPKLEKILGI